MRIVVLCSSVYSETACAMAVRMAELGYVPVGALALSTMNRATLLRKLGQWGVREFARYARAKLIPTRGDERRELHNPYLRPLLKRGEGDFSSLRGVASHYRFPIAVCSNQNAPNSITRLKEWSPDLIIFTGGNILRKQLLHIPRLGVLNVHLGLLAEIRGMSSPEWSLLNHVPVGITIHYMDAGIDTGPILQRCELPDVNRCESLSDLRNRLIAFGVEKIGEVVSRLDRGTISAKPQAALDSADSALNSENVDSANNDNQFFVMHDWLQARAADQLMKNRMAVAGTANG